MIAAGQAPGRIHNNCSGKHAGMLAHCVQQQWVTNGYHRAAHPMQQRVISTLARWMRINADDMSQGIDGCGLPTFAIALDAVAEGCAKFSAAVADRRSGAVDDLQGDGQRIRNSWPAPIASTPT